MSSRHAPASSASSSSSTTTKRLLKELAQFSDTTSPDAVPPGPIERLAPLSSSDLLHWECVLSGRGLGGGYDSGRWLLDIIVPNGGSARAAGAYPNAPPVVRFVTRICAPNVGFETGEICLDLLNTAWTPAYTLKTTIDAIWQMLAAPAVDSPLNVDLAALVRGGDKVGAEGVVRWGCEEWRWSGR